MTACLASLWKCSKSVTATASFLVCDLRVCSFPWSYVCILNERRTSLALSRFAVLPHAIVSAKMAYPSLVPCPRVHSLLWGHAPSPQPNGIPWTCSTLSQRFFAVQLLCLGEGDGCEFQFSMTLPILLCKGVTCTSGAVSKVMVSGAVFQHHSPQGGTVCFEPSKLRIRDNKRRSGRANRIAWREGVAGRRAGIEPAEERPAKIHSYTALTWA